VKGLQKVTTIINNLEEPTSLQRPNFLFSLKCGLGIEGWLEQYNHSRSEGWVDQSPFTTVKLTHIHTPRNSALTQHEGSDDNEVCLEGEDEEHGVEREHREEQTPGHSYEPQPPQLVA